MLKSLLDLLLFPHIECVPVDDRVCLIKSPGWASNRDCEYARKYCDSWAKDAKRCCPQTCESGLLTKAQCESLSSKGTCIYPTKSQCPNEGIKDKIGFSIVTLLVYYMYKMKMSSICKFSVNLNNSP